jgi:hypothetical protein
MFAAERRSLRQTALFFVVEGLLVKQSAIESDASLQT